MARVRIVSMQSFSMGQPSRSGDLAPAVPAWSVAVVALSVSLKS